MENAQLLLCVTGAQFRKQVVCRRRYRKEEGKEFCQISWAPNTDGDERAETEDNNPSTASVRHKGIYNKRSCAEHGLNKDDNGTPVRITID